MGAPSSGWNLELFLIYSAMEDVVVVVAIVLPCPTVPERWGDHVKMTCHMHGCKGL